ncbi:MAG TPA: MFS transporter [Candidatus Limnocylindria bacterium]
MSVIRGYLDLFRRSPALARLLAGEFVSGIGDWLYLIAILVVVYAESGSPVLLGVVGAARILPYVLLSVPAGIVADRFDRRMVLLVTDVARGVLMLALAAAVTVDAHVGVVIGLSILAACFSTFFNPAIAALVPTLVDESDLGPANSAWATLDNLAFIIGPALAGILLATGGLQVAFLLNAASFAVVAVVLWRLPVPGRGATAASRDEAAASAPLRWRSLARTLIGPFVLDASTSFVSGGVSVLTVILAVDVLGAGEAGTGYLNAAVGVGGVAAGIAGGSLLARPLRIPLLAGGLIGGVGLAGLGLSTALPFAMLAIAVAVAGVLLLEIVTTTLIQRVVPDELRGRAVGVIQTSSAILYSLGSLTVPILASTLGHGPVLVGSAVLVLIGALTALVLSGRGVEATSLPAATAALFEHPIFAGLPVARLESAARQLVEVPVAPGQVVIRQGDSADRFYLVGDGTLSVTQVGDEEERELRRIGRGDVFGEIGLLRGVPRTATVTAVTDGNLFALDATDFADLVGSGPGLGTRLLDLYRGALARS